MGVNDRTSNTNHQSIPRREYEADPSARTESPCIRGTVRRRVVSSSCHVAIPPLSGAMRINCTDAQPFSPSMFSRTIARPSIHRGGRLEKTESGQTSR
jgi:hypothetical protein